MLRPSRCRTDLLIACRNWHSFPGSMERHPLQSMGGFPTTTPLPPMPVGTVPLSDGAAGQQGRTANGPVSHTSTYFHFGSPVVAALVPGDSEYGHPESPYAVIA